LKDGHVILKYFFEFIMIKQLKSLSWSLPELILVFPDQLCGWWGFSGVRLIMVLKLFKAGSQIMLP